MRANLIQGNALNIPLKDGCVQCCATSPSYYGLRDYGVLGQLGLEQTLAEYIENMVSVFAEVHRVLRDDGTCWVNMGDSYNGSGGAGGDYNAGGLKEGQPRYPGRHEVNLKPKDLMLVPHRLAIALQEWGAVDVNAMRVIGRVRDELLREYEYWYEIPDKVLNAIDRLDAEYAEAKGNGWWVRSDIVWHKPNPMPESVQDRPTKSHEYIFLLSKSARYYYDADAIREEQKPESEARYGYSFGGAKNEHLLVTDNQTAVVGSRAFRSSGRNKRTVWTITTKPYSGAHFATFPPELPETCIKAGTSEKGQCPECGAPWERVVEKKHYGTLNDESKRYTEGITRNKFGGQKEWDVYVPPQTTGWRPTCEHEHEPVPQIVLDPFNGSGTTVEVAQRLGRIGVGVDLSWEYLQLARERTGLAQMDEWKNGKKPEAANLEGLPMFND